MEADAAPGEHVFLDDVGELVDRLLALDREPVQAAAELAHHEGDRGQQDGDEHGELPVEPDQVAEQGDEAKRIADQALHRIDELGGAVLDLEGQGVDEIARGVAREQRRLGVEDALEHRAPHRLRAAIGGPGEAVLRHESGQPAQGRQADHRDRHGPERDRALLHAVVEEDLEQRRDRRLGRGGDDGADEGEHEAAPAVGEERPDPAQPLAELASGDLARQAGGVVAGRRVAGSAACFRRVGGRHRFGRARLFGGACRRLDARRRTHAGNSGRVGGLCMNMSFTYL